MKKSCKSLLTVGMTIGLSASFTLLSFAGWEQTGATWKYNENGTYITGWNWLDGNNDGVAECYYFNAEGVMLASTTTPDNYIVNENGAWVVDGVVQTKAVETHPVSQQTEPQATEAYVEPEQPAYTPGSTVTDANGVTVEIGDISRDQHLSDEEIDSINRVNFNSGGIDTSGWDLGNGVKVEPGQVNTDQHLSPEQNKSINDIDFN